MHNYNLHRHHTAIGSTPANRANNLYGHYSLDLVVGVETHFARCSVEPRVELGWAAGDYG